MLADSHVTTHAPSELTRRFSAWAIELLQEAQREAEGDHPAATNGTHSVLADELGELSLAGLIDRVRQLGPITHGVPAERKDAVSDLASRLYAAYTVADGSVTLAGCTLELRALLWLVFRSDDGPSSRLVDAYLSSLGEPLDPQLVRDLGADRLVPLDKPPRLTDEEVQRLMDLGQRLAQEQQQQATKDDGPPPTVELVSATIVWCRFAEGKLRFNIGKKSAELPFADWAHTIQPPPFVCPASGEKSYHIAATDEGRIVAAESLGVCARSGRHKLLGDLRRCAVTGQLLAPEFVETCPATGDVVSSELLRSCPVCRVRVTPRILTNESCVHCSQQQPVTTSDPRLVRVFEEYSTLEKWRSWRLAETPVVYILSAAGLFKRLLVVLDKQTLAIRRLATASRLKPDWVDVEPERYQEVLGGDGRLEARG